MPQKKNRIFFFRIPRNVDIDGMLPDCNVIKDRDRIFLCVSVPPLPCCLSHRFFALDVFPMIYFFLIRSNSTIDILLFHSGFYTISCYQTNCFVFFLSNEFPPIYSLLLSSVQPTAVRRETTLLLFYFVYDSTIEDCSAYLLLVTVRLSST